METSSDESSESDANGPPEKKGRVEQGVLAYDESDNDIENESEEGLVYDDFYLDYVSDSSICGSIDLE